ncbi:cysteine proteinase [Aaosphaeria arxii CBS 175.79]|uniref:Cysteine proteinase n=1 Tax=Aaosphaeria arxii CBS 175.79 TaxID=1450172 RepID=A0A6A5XEV4_9PLEO|nr:cysteine proteinase [Aaosphaeria arxii CBS 175.79]KAF2011638.1 cysteine proteinase [Aaosphaeria arxii CBS 175.79]
MADAKFELAAHKAAASRYQAQMHTATTRDEAVQWAIKAAESLMEAVKVSRVDSERQDLKKQCREVMDFGQRVKQSEEWAPQQATCSTSTTQPAQNRPSPGNASKLEERQEIASFSETSKKHRAENSTESRNITNLTASATYNMQTLDISGSSKTTTTNQRTSNEQSRYTQSRMDPASTSQTAQLTTYPNNTDVPLTKVLRVKQLPAPASTRKLSKRETIIIWQASAVNGFKFPPWEKPPATSDFAHSGAPFIDSPTLNLSPHQQELFAGWVRSRDALPPPSFTTGPAGIGVDSTEPSASIDLVQDAATDCSVVASLCAIVARDARGHSQMLANIIWPSASGEPLDSPNGKYMFRLNVNGCWRKVVIDDRLPLSNSHRLLHVIDRNNPSTAWPALLEKAYLKVCGGYDFPGSNSCNDLWTLTGWIPEQIYLQETDTVPDQLWNRVFKGFLYGDVLVTAGTGKLTSRQERDLGLESQHSYAILDMKETEEDQFFLVKNPWVEGKGWRGRAPSIVPGLQPQVTDAGTKTASGTKHPTTFWISLHDVIRHFESLYLNWNPGLFSHRQDVHFEWPIEHQRKSGRCVFRNPQFSVSVRKTDEVWLLLSRHVRDAIVKNKPDSNAAAGDDQLQTQQYTTNEPLPGYISVYVCDGNGERVYMKESYLEHTPEVNTPQALLRWRAHANSTYTVVVEQDELPPSTYSFSLSAFSGSAISLEPVISRYSFSKVIEGEWTKQTVGGTVDLPTYFYNPQYTLEVKSRCSVAILLRSVDHSHPMHATLAMGDGKRLFRLQTRDILADSGGYRDQAVFAEIRDLEPGVYTIICSLFEAGKSGGFVLQVDSTSEVVVKQVPREGAGLIPYYGLEPACFGPEMDRLAAPVQLHRLARFSIVAQFLRARSPQAYDLGLQARSPLLLSVEMGRGPEKRIVVQSEGGQHSDSLTIRTGSFDLSLNDQDGKHLWLVLDRLSKPSGPVEELYEVKVWTDVPNACRIGSWQAWDD